MKGGKPDPKLIEQGKELKAKLAEKEPKLAEIEQDFITKLKQVPNVYEDDVPIGLTEDDNQVAEVCGEPTKFKFAPKNHYEIGQARGWIDKERASKVAGARFAYIKGDMVKLQMAIVNFVMNSLSNQEVIHEIIDKAGLKGQVVDKPFTIVLPPLMLRTEMYDAMDRLEPREDRYKIEGEELWLQGSAEHVLGSMHAGEIFEEKELPVRYLGYATSFRQEAGTYGKDMEGIIRMHQFDKLEMESFSTKETSRKEHELFVAIQRWLVEQLELPYRVIRKCTFDIGKPDARGIDIEVWLPGQDKYRETHTADYMTDYQSRRLQTRVRRDSGDLELVHTNDATAFALGRIMIAIIENYQNEDMTVRVPKVLQKYLDGKEII
jgi:seryl-tRNA synthetase